MTDYTLDGGQWEALKAAVQSPANRGPEFEVACTVQKADHLHVQRLGEPGSGLAARVGVMMHDGAGNTLLVYLAAPQARQVAAAFLNAADECDGKTPLVFMPEDPETSFPPVREPVAAEEDEDVVEGEIVEEGDEEDPYDAEALIGQTVTLLRDGTPVRVHSVHGRLSTGEPIYRVRTESGAIGVVSWSALSDPE